MTAVASDAILRDEGADGLFELLVERWSAGARGGQGSYGEDEGKGAELRHKEHYFTLTALMPV